MAIVTDNVVDSELTSRGILSNMAADPASRAGTNPVLRMQNDSLQGAGYFRTAAPLPPEAGEQMDSVISEIGDDRLAVAALL